MKAKLVVCNVHACDDTAATTLSLQECPSCMRCNSGEGG
jgi:hypothetical protein